MSGPPASQGGALTPERWERVSGAFAEALDLEPEVRAAYVDEVCADDTVVRREVRAMLAAHEGDRPLHIEERLLGPDDDTEPVGGSLVPGTRVGPYRIEAPVREGGMGEVYRAERVDGEYRQTVALKVLRASLRSPELVRRFHTERQILARLAHPDIAPILGGGATDDGRPYLVMQFVDGLPITHFCDRNELGLEARLALFRRVAEAVQYAHGRLVVHRDLKPSNILVTPAGEPRLLDFGIAKLLVEDEDGGAPRERTRSLLRLLTPDYAAPEQIRGEPATTATDVYALGVLLYEMLAGRRPERPEARRRGDLRLTLLEDPPPAPSAVVADRTLARRLRGDLDRIVLMALREEPERRYASAAQLAEDVERYLGGLPVRAQRDTLRYRARKFVARNRAAVAAAAGLVLVLAASTVTATVQGRRVARERDRAEAERASAEAVVQLLTGLFERANPRIVPGGDTVRVAALLDEGERRVDSLVDQPTVQARMWRVLGTMHSARGQYPRAIDLLRRSYDRQRAIPGSAPAEMARTYHELALAVLAYRGGAAARPMLDSSLAWHRGALPDDHPDVVQATQDLALATTDLDEHQALLEQVLALRRKAGGADPVAVAGALNALGGERHARGRGAEAVTLFETSLRLLEGALPRGHPHRATVQHNLAAALLMVGDIDRAAPLVREALDTRRALGGGDGSALGTSLEQSAVLHAHLGDLASAEEAMREALAVFRRTLAPDHWRVANALRNLGVTAALRGRIDEGIARYDSARVLDERRGDARPADVAFHRASRAMMLLWAGRTDEGVPAAREAAAAVRAATPEGDGKHADVQGWLAMAALAAGDPAAALAHFDSALVVLSGTLPSTHPRLAGSACGRGVSLAALRRHADAAPLLRDACPVYERDGLADPVLVRRAREARSAAAR